MLDGPLQTRGTDEHAERETSPVSTTTRQHDSTPATSDAVVQLSHTTLTTIDELRSERANSNNHTPLQPPQEAPISAGAETPVAARPTATPEALPGTVSPTSIPIEPSTPPAQIVAIGDSVMVGTTRELRAALGDITIDAAVSRQAKTAIAMLRARHDAGKLGNVVIIHMGTNGPVSARQFDEMMSVLSDVRRVVFVTVKVPRRWEGPNNAVIVDGVKRYPNTVLADWHAAGAGHPELFARDGVHPQRAGARLFARVITTAVNGP